jgi:hypothetical protein
MKRPIVFSVCGRRPVRRRNHCAAIAPTFYRSYYGGRRHAVVARTLHRGRVNRLSTEDFEDMSLVYSNVTKR